MSDFRYQGKSIFLTYAKCPLDKEVIFEHIKTVAEAANVKIEKACIGQEHHADGDLHLHACVWFNKRFRFRGAQTMDCQGYHPNVKDSRIKNKRRALAYC